MKLLLVAAAIVFATVFDLLLGTGEHVRAVTEWAHTTAYDASLWFGSWF